MEERVICSLKSYSSLLFFFWNKTGNWRKWLCSYCTAQTHQDGFDLNHFIFLSQPIQRWILTPSFISGMLHTVLCEKGMLSVVGFLISKLNSNSCHRKCPFLRDLITRKAAWQPWPIYDCTVNSEISSCWPEFIRSGLRKYYQENYICTTSLHCCLSTMGPELPGGSIPGPLHIRPGSVPPSLSLVSCGWSQVAMVARGICHWDKVTPFTCTWQPPAFSKVYM